MLLDLKVRLYYKLAWEPSVAQVIHSYSSRLPALGQFYPLNLKPQNQEKNIPVAIPSSQI